MKHFRTYDLTFVNLHRNYKGSAPKKLPPLLPEVKADVLGVILIGADSAA
jgi:hypothetical protein